MVYLLQLHSVFLGLLADYTDISICYLMGSGHSTGLISDCMIFATDLLYSYF